MAEIHRYYIAKAAAALREARALPDADPMPLARWASQPSTTDLALVAADGRILGGARRTRGLVSAFYVTWCDAEPGLVGYEIGFARRVAGVPVVHISWSEVAHGADPRR